LLYADLIHRVEERLCRPFPIHRTEGVSLDISEPGMIEIGASQAAVALGSTKDSDGCRVATGVRILSLEHIVKIVEH